MSLFISSTLFAGEDKGVIILNSDMSIYKYSLAQSELKSKITNLKGEIDLGSKWIDERKVKKRILECKSGSNLLYRVEGVPDGSQAVRKKEYSLFSGDKLASPSNR